MQFFDFNIPYNEDDNPSSSSGKTLAAAADKSKTTKHKNNRLKLAVKAMELGYSGVAYNRTISGVMSDSDRCSISPFPVSSLLKLSPSLASSATFRRLLLGVSADSTFRQYTRLTVAVDNSAQVSAINSRNPIPKSYDLVAVRPLNQSVFEQACQSSEVDLISIDFSDKLPFRLKLPAIKAAVARGVFFEICYSPLLGDVHLRTQITTNAKLLVDWTRGKNLIVSSCASSVLGVRGPADVANLLFLLGLPLQQAKAAISRNCRSMLTSALKKKQFYKEAICVEPMASHGHSSFQEPWIIDWMKWDPISSGEGDLLLEDIAKSFSDVGKSTKAVKALDRASSRACKLSSGLQSTDLKSKVGDLSHKMDNLGEEQEVPFPPEKTTILSQNTHLNSQPHELEVFKTPSPRESSKAFLDLSEIGTSLRSPQKLECAELVTDRSHAGIRSQLEDSTSISLAGMLLEESLKNASTTRSVLDARHTAHSSSDVSGMFEDLDPHNSQVVPKAVEIGNGISSHHSNLNVQASTGREVIDASYHSLISLDLAFQSLMEREGFRESESNASLQADGMMPMHVQFYAQDDDLIVLSSDSQDDDDDDLIVLSPPTDSKTDENCSMVPVTRGAIHAKISTDTNSTGSSDSAEVSSRRDFLEGEDLHESKSKAHMRSKGIMQADTSPDRRLGCSASVNCEVSKEVATTRKRRINHIKPETDVGSASVSSGDAEFDHGIKKRGVDKDRFVMGVLQSEEDMLQGNILRKCTKANSLSSRQSKPVERKFRHRVPRQGVTFPSKHLLQVSFKRKAATRCKARKS